MLDTNISITSRNTDEVLPAIRTNITQFGLVITFFKKNHPDFFDVYHKAILIIDTGLLNYSNIQLNPGIVHKRVASYLLDLFGCFFHQRKKQKWISY